jgi:hypothetical protein
VAAVWSGLLEGVVVVVVRVACFRRALRGTVESKARAVVIDRGTFGACVCEIRVVVGCVLIASRSRQSTSSIGGGSVPSLFSQDTDNLLVME